MVPSRPCPDPACRASGNARWWLLGVVALCALGYLWVRSPDPRTLPPVREASTTTPRETPSRNGARHDVSDGTSLPTPSTVNPPAPAESSPATPIAPDLTPGTATALGTVVVRSNFPAITPPREPLRSLSTNAPGPETPINPSTSTNGAASATGPPGGFSRDVFEAQLALARMGISSGSLDGKLGLQTRSAIRAFQEREGLPTSGGLDAATRSKLALAPEPLTVYTLTPEDQQRLRPLAKTWLGKSEQDRMDFESLLELVAEKFQSHPALIRQLNPLLDWEHIAPGTSVTVPNVDRPALSGRASLIRIQLGAKTLEVFDAASRLMAHFPCSIARDKEKRPVGELHVEKIAPNPNYTFNPEVFPESEEARQLNRKLILQPGPNNPVGVAWISLDRPGYGIHGTPNPEQVGRTESHGCFRLANWNAELLVRLVWIGMPVQVEP